MAEYIVNGLIQAGNRLIDWITTQLIKIATLIPDLLLSTPLSFIKSDGFDYIYNIIFVLSCSISAAIVTYQAFKIALGKITVDQFIDHFWKVLLLPVFSYFAVDIVSFFITQANSLTEAIVNTVYHVSPSSSDSVFTSTLTQWSFILFIPAYLWYVFKLFLYYAWRNFRILELSMYAPAIYLIDCIPSHTGKISMWINELNSLLLTQVAHALQYLLLALVTVHAGDNPLMFLTQIGCLMSMDKTTKLIKRYITPNNTLSTAGGEIEKKLNKVKSGLKRVATSWFRGGS